MDTPKCNKGKSTCSICQGRGTMRMYVGKEAQEVACQCVRRRAKAELERNGGKPFTILPKDIQAQRIEERSKEILQ